MARKANPLATKNYLLGKIDEYVKQAGRDTMMLNIQRDPYDVGYARIPDGGACDFCVMLGSRGFVYHSEESAGGDSLHGTKMDRYHPYCNCQIAVSFDRAILEYYKNGVHVTRGFDEIVQNAYDYDPDKLFEEYLAAGKSYGGGSGSRTGRARDGTKLTSKKFGEYRSLLEEATTMEELMAANDTIVRAFKGLKKSAAKDKQWSLLSSIAINKKAELSKAANGISQKTIVSEVSQLRKSQKVISKKVVPPEIFEVSAAFPKFGEIEVRTYAPSKDYPVGWVKFAEKATPDEFEIADAEILSEMGFEIKFLERSLSKRRADVTVDGRTWEFKNPSGAGALSVHNQIKSNLYGTNKHKLLPQSDKVVISNIRSSLSFEEMEKQLVQVMNGQTRMNAAELSRIKEVMLLDKSGKAKHFIFR